MAKAGHATRKAANKAKKSEQQAFLDGLAHVDVFPDAKSAWDDFNKMAGGDKRSLRQQQNAKFIFMSGYQRAANLFVYCAGATQSIEIAAAQFEKDFMDYDAESRQVLAERKAEYKAATGEDISKADA
jgi:hypothetical protein